MLSWLLHVNFVFFIAVSHNNYCHHKQWTLTHRNTQNGLKSNDHKSQAMNI